MGWLQFKQLPADIQHEYINKLIAEYDASQSFFAKMFGISINTFKRYMEVIGFNHVFVQRRPTALVMQAQARFLGVVAEDTADADREEVAEETRRTDAPSAPENIKAAMRFDSFTLRFSGPFDPEALCNSLAAMIGRGQRVKIEIECEVEGD